MSDLTIRPMQDEDLPALVALANAAERELGLPETVSPADVIAEWRAPGFERETMSRVVLDGERLVARAHARPRETEMHGGGYVHPDARGRGIGTELLRWQIGLARARHGMATYMTGAAAQSTGAIALLERHGFEHVRTWWNMHNPRPGDVAQPEWPEGIALRPLDGEELLARAAEGYNASFIDHFNFHPLTAEHWRPFVDDPDFDPGQMHFAFAGAELAGFCVTQIADTPSGRIGDIGPIGTARGFRGIGLGRALLRHACRNLAARGCVDVTLGVDSENPHGAVGLYARNGFETTHEGRSYRLLL